MKITKQGKQKSVVYFICRNCGCEFNCTIDECKRKFYDDEDCFIHTCPCCNQNVGYTRCDVGYDYFTRRSK